MTSLRRLTFQEKLEKTINMIIGSPAYQRYVASRRQRENVKALGGNYFVNVMFRPDPLRDCVTCGARACKPRSFERCTECRRELVLEAHRAGRTTKEIAELAGVKHNNVYLILRKQSDRDVITASGRHAR